MDAEALEAQCAEQIVDDEHDLRVRGIRGGADGIEVALPELAKAALGRVFTAPHRT